MTSERCHEVEAVLLELDTLPPAGRASHLAKRCAGDTQLREQVEAVLHDRAQLVATLDNPAMPLGRATGDDASIAGLQLGPWRIMGLLGRGGMGEVYEAHRADGSFELRAAVKLMKRGLDTEALVRRFLLERRILAKLVHPNIAHLLDAGMAPDGRPYLVMEFVQGVPIHQYAASRPHSTRELLQLMLTVCQAVQVAHAAQVVHRDLKPTNVLVTPEGQVKLLDFGIARLITEDGGDATHLAGEMAPLTPSYAAPEQLMGAAATPASDVYALGVILYEMLTGRLPHDRRGVAISQLAQHAQRESTIRPSTALRQERGRMAEPERIQRLKDVSRDLDLIVLKALHPDQPNRYPNAQALADDLVAVLEHKPVRARPDSPWYRTTRFVRRHRIAVSAAAAVVAALSAGLAIALWQMHAATVARNEALAARNEATARREQADDLIGFMLGDLKQQLEGLGRLNLLDATVAKTMKYLGTSDINQSVETLARRSEALTVVAELRYAQGNIEEAIASGKDAVQAARALVRRAPSDFADEHLARALYAEGEPSLEAGHYAETTPGTDEALAIAVRLLAADPASVQLSTLAASLYDQRAYIDSWGPEPVPASAQANWRHCIETLKPSLTRDDAWPPQLRYLIRCEAALGVSLYLSKVPHAELVGAFDAMIADAEVATRRFPEDRSLLGVILYGLSNATASYEQAQQPSKAERALSQSLMIGRQLVAFEPNNVEFRRQLMQALRRQAQHYLVREQWTAARPPLDEAIQMSASVLEGTANSRETRRMVMYLRTLRAYQIIRGSRDRAAALEEIRLGLAQFQADDTDANLLQAATDLNLTQWTLARDHDAALAHRAEGESRRLVELLDAKQDPTLLEWRPAAVHYLSGDIEAGDRQPHEPYWLAAWMRAQVCAHRACPAH